MNAPGLRKGACSDNAGFTLMETLVMLMLVSMAATMMFQMLQSYRIAQERIAAQAGNQDRSSLFDAWFVEGVHGLLADPDKSFKGSRLEFAGRTLNPLFGPPGAPAEFSWKLHATPEGGDVSYAEDGAARWTLPLRDFDGSRFIYFAPDGSQYDQWPPAKGLNQDLPAAIAFIRGAGAGEKVRLAVVMGPLVPRDLPYTLEVD
ncbi:MAG: hypothetical protein ABIW30_05265 [Arenimonas sp.]